MDASRLPRKMRGLVSRLGHDTGAAWLAFIIAVLLVVLGGWQTRSTAERAAGTRAAQLAETVALDVDRSLEVFDLTLRTVTGGARSLTSQELTPQQRNAILSERTPRDRSIDFIDVLDADGNVLASLTPQGGPTNWSRRDYFEAQRRSTTDDYYVGSPYATESQDRVGFTLSRRITDHDGKFAGVVVMGVRLTVLQDLFGRHELGADDSVQLLRQDGAVLALLPFDLKAIGHPPELGTQFYSFMNTGRNPAVAGTYFAFRRVGNTPLVVEIAHRAGGAVPDPLLWWLLPAGAALATSLGLLTHGFLREKRAREAAEYKSSEKSRHLTTLSHQWRTQLHGVLGHADHLSRDARLKLDQSRRVAEIINAAKRMRSDVNVVLDYARLEALGPRLHMQNVELRDVIEGCMDTVGPAARARGLETHVIVAADAPAEFVTDMIQFHHVLMNLLDNAVKYTPTGMVELRLAGSEERITIEVVDTGVGIPPGQRHRLFKEFERFGFEKTGIEGTGLGLASAQRLIRRMGGCMGHRDNPGGGSIFWFELPAGVPDEPVPATPIASSHPVQELNVLVVDDSSLAREVAEQFLRSAGHRVTTAGDGAAAIRLAANDDYDLVLMDMMMPGQDGLGVTRQIRALEGPRGRVPIIAMTANALDQQAEECRQAGMSEHLTKPFTQAELLAVIARLTGACRALHTRVVDVSRMTELAETVGTDALERHLDCLALRVQDLLRRIEDPAGTATTEDLRHMAHELVGSAGTLGFIDLASAADRFCVALSEKPGDARQEVQEMFRQASAALEQLHHRRAAE